MLSPNTRKKIKEKSLKNGDNRKKAESSNKDNKDKKKTRIKIGISGEELLRQLPSPLESNSVSCRKTV